MKTILLQLMHWCVKKVLAKYNPIVIGITGSAGKTATKEAVFSVLSQKYHVRKNRGNYNTEWGVAFTVLGVKNPRKNPFAWVGLFMRATRLMLSKQTYPEMLVLELAADKPGDIQLLVQLVKPTLGVITSIGEAHAEAFGSVDAIAKEKNQLFKAIPKNGWVVGNTDDARVRALLLSAQAKQKSFGIASSDAAYRAAEINYTYTTAEHSVTGMRFKLMENSTVVPLAITGIIGEHQLYPLLAAAAVGSIYDVHAVALSDALLNIELQPGRMRILSGIKHTTVIDDTYNASPSAVAYALDTLTAIETTANRIAVLGDMLELGPLSEEAHAKIGAHVAACGIGLLITVGERSRDIARGAVGAGMNQERVCSFATTTEAGLFLQERMHKEDVVLIKGSRGMRLERVVKEVMAEPDRASELLVH